MAKAAPTVNPFANRFDGMVIGHGKYKGLTRKDAKAALEIDILKQQEYDLELVRGRFKNLQKPGAGADFALRIFPHEPLTTWTFEDGMEYEIPRYVARHINKNCYIPRYETFKGMEMEGDAVRGALHNGRLKTKQMAYDVRKDYRFAFIPTSFSADDIGLDQSQLSEVIIR